MAQMSERVAFYPMYENRKRETFTFKIRRTKITNAFIMVGLFSYLFWPSKNRPKTILHPPRYTSRRRAVLKNNTDSPPPQTRYKSIKSHRHFYRLSVGNAELVSIPIFCTLGRTYSSIFDTSRSLSLFDLYNSNLSFPCVSFPHNTHTILGASFTALFHLVPNRSDNLWHVLSCNKHVRRGAASVRGVQQRE